VDDGHLACMAILSPLSARTALLTVSWPDSRLLGSTPQAVAPEHAGTELPEVVSSVLGVVYDIMEKEGDGERLWHRCYGQDTYWGFHRVVESSYHLKLVSLV